MLNSLKNFLKKIDHFGTEFTFEYESKDKYHSITGGIVFLIFILIKNNIRSKKLINSKTL